MQQCVIYAIRNSVNGKRYIGSTGNFINRKKKHLADLRRGQHHSCVLQSAFDKYGESSFVFERLEIISNSADLLIREQTYLDDKPEYNVSYIAKEKTRLGMKSTPEHRANMSAALKGRVSPNKGKKLTEEHKKKISAALIGNKCSLGRKLTTETKNRIRKNHNCNSDKNLNRKGGTIGRKWKTKLQPE